MQHLIGAADVSGDKDPAVAAAHGGRVERRCALIIKCNTRMLERQPIEIGLPAHRGEHLVNDHGLLARAHTDTSSFILQFGRVSEPQGESPGHHFDRTLPGARIRQPGNGFCLVNSGDCYAKLRQRLSEFQANDAKAHHGHRFRQVFLFKQGVAGENLIAKVHPRRRHHRAGPARDDDVLSLDDVIADLQPAGLNEARIAIEKLLFHLVCAVPQHPIYQNVAKVANMFKNVRQVGG